MPETNRVVVVTGATGALGRAVVDAFRSRGDQVAEVSRSAPQFAANLTDMDEAQAVIQQILQHYGRLDVLVHTMGGFAGGKPFAETSADIWERMMAVNFRSALYVCSSAVPFMVRAGWGRVIAVGSRTGVEPAANLSAYGVSKAALNTLIQTIALEVKDSGVTANVVLPSTIDTEANRAWGSAGEAARWVKPESIAETIAWLASGAAADINGALIPVYGRA